MRKCVINTVAGAVNTVAKPVAVDSLLAHNPPTPRRRLRLSGAAAILSVLAVATGAMAEPAFIPNYIATSTMPPNGDVNPYGVAFVPPGFPSGGTIAPGQVLVSNFNNKNNLQGTGTTIVKITPNGDVNPPGDASLFWNSTTAGLDTGLSVLTRGFVVVCNIPTTNGQYATRGPGSILVLNKRGALVTTLPGGSSATKINGPWDMTVFDQGNTAKLFVSSVGVPGSTKGYVTRLDVSVSSSGISIVSSAVIALGYQVVPNAAAFVFGPTGLVYDPATDTLYVASTADNAVYAVSSAGTRTTNGGKGTVVFNDSSVLRGPLGMAQAPNGDLIVANGDGVNGDVHFPSEYVEFTKGGAFVSQFNIDVNQGGAFGIATGTAPDGAPILAAVDDNVPNLTIFTGAAPSINGTKQ